MAYSHSFSPEFYGDPYGERKRSARPKNVCDALFSMPRAEWDRMCREVFCCKSDYIDIETLLEKVIETDTVSNLDTPVQVWIDKDGFWSVNVY